MKPLWKIDKVNYRNSNFVNPTTLETPKLHHDDYKIIIIFEHSFDDIFDLK